MDLNKDILNDFIKDFSSLEGIPLSDIPNIDLYMDQVTTFFDDKLSPWKLDDEDKILTKTMINNYAKADILFPPIKKKYSKEHMVLLILIYHLKQILSLSDIHTLLFPIIQKNMSKDSFDLYSLYEQFLDIQKDELENLEGNFFKKVDALFEGLETQEDADYPLLLLTVMNLVISSSIQKNLAEKLIYKFKKTFIK
ncbi:MAG: DUF1836 domain-containing protein [Epulopiscium sp.]|nr:DUF1836 domain-containing protein [Candidatus Epulonipiscium sp.]